VGTERSNAEQMVRTVFRRLAHRFREMSTGMFRNKAINAAFHFSLSVSPLLSVLIES
jgi:hypothetical protein